MSSQQLLKKKIVPIEPNVDMLVAGRKQFGVLWLKLLQKQRNNE